MDTASLVAISGSVGGLLGILLTKGVDGVIKLRRAKIDDALALRQAEEAECHHDEERIDENYKFLIAKLEGQLATVREDLNRTKEEARLETERSRQEHLECERKYAKLEGKIEEMEKMFFRHELASKQQVELLEDQVKELEELKAREAMRIEAERVAQEKV